MYYSPSPVSWNNYHFLILASPDNDSIDRCLTDLKNNNVKHLCRSCEKTYDESLLTKADI